MFTRIDCDPNLGVRLLSQTDTFAAEPLGRIIRKDSMTHPDRHEVRRWQVLVSAAGQMGEGNLFGRSMIADARLEGGFVGPDTFVIEFDEPGSDINLWTYAVLNSTIGLYGICAHSGEFEQRFRFKMSSRSGQFERPSERSDASG